MLRISWTKKITNEKVLELAGNKRSLMETIRKRQLSFVGHTTRENGLQRLCLEGRIESKKIKRKTALDLSCELGGNCRTHLPSTDSLCWVQKRVPIIGRQS